MDVRPHLVSEVRGDVLLHTIERPDRRNAISPQVIEGIAQGRRSPTFG